MIDILNFLLVKIFSIAVLAIAFVLPALFFVALTLSMEPNGKLAPMIWRWSVGTVLSMCYISYVAWAWPFGVPYEKTFHQHPSGTAWNIITESFDQYRERTKEVPPPVRTELGTELRRFELVSWNPPKHFYVTLKDVQTGQLYEGQYVSKHCSTGTLKHGEQYNLQVRYFRMSDTPDQKRMEFTNLYSAFCGG